MLSLFVTLRDFFVFCCNITRPKLSLVYSIILSAYSGHCAHVVSQNSGKISFKIDIFCLHK
jgi:hypothetical protein